MVPSVATETPVTPPGIDPGTSLLTAQCLNHYATTDPTYIYTYIHINTYIHKHANYAHFLSVGVCGELLLNFGHHLPISTESCRRRLEYLDVYFLILLSVLTATN
jgi:hypothetical protein